MPMVEHLAELRTRLFRIVLYVVAAMIATYSLFESIFTLLAYPALPLIEKLGGKFVYSNLSQPFLLQLQVSLVSGLVAAFPFITLEIWGYVSPALSHEERRPVLFLAPFSVLLFVSGVGTAYASLPAAYAWMLSFIGNVDGASLYQNPLDYLLLTSKILLSFGISFELPIILLFLGRIGVINADMMTRYWRHSVVLIAALAGVLTPSNDPLTMLMMAVPMAGLYVLSIGLVRAFAPRPDGSRSLSLAVMILVALAPASILGAVGYWLWRAHG